MRLFWVLTLGGASAGLGCGGTQGSRAGGQGGVDEVSPVDGILLAVGRINVRGSTPPGIGPPRT
jgi:hypothetical protein